MVAGPRAETVYVDEGNVDVGAADQGIMFGYASGAMGDEMPHPQQAVCMSARIFLRWCGRPRHYVWHANDETEVTIPLPHLMPARLGKKLNDGRKNGDLWWLRPYRKTSRNGHSLDEFA